VIRPLRAEDVPAALALLEEGIGPGWIGPDDLRPGPSRHLVVAEEGGRVVGAAACAVRPLGEVLAELPSNGRARLGAFAGDDPATAPVVVLDVAAVGPRYRGRGHYAGMLDSRMEWARAAGADIALAIGWAPPDGCHIAGSVGRAGFARLAELPGYYEGLDGQCPHCGRPCRCAAVLFARRLSPAGAAPAPGAGGR